MSLAPLYIFFAPRVPQPKPLQTLHQPQQVLEKKAAKPDPFISSASDPMRYGDMRRHDALHKPSPNRSQERIALQLADLMKQKEFAEEKVSDHRDAVVAEKANSDKLDNLWDILKNSDFNAPSDNKSLARLHKGPFGLAIKRFTENHGFRRNETQRRYERETQALHQIFGIKEGSRVRLNEAFSMLQKEIIILSDRKKPLSARVESTRGQQQKAIVQILDINKRISKLNTVLEPTFPERKNNSDIIHDLRQKILARDASASSVVTEIARFRDLCSLLDSGGISQNRFDSEVAKLKTLGRAMRNSPES
jgi:hypothetical protein